MLSYTILETIDGEYFLAASTEQACDADVQHTCEYIGAIDTMSPERMNQSILFTGSWLPDDIYALGRALYKVVFRNDVSWANCADWKKVQAEKEKLAHKSADAKILLQNPQLSKDILRLLALWMLHPDRKERPCIASVCNVLIAIFPSNLPGFACYYYEGSEEVFLDKSNPKACAELALKILKSSGLQAGYGYIPRESTSTKYQILGSLEKKWVLLLPKKEDSKKEWGTFKIGRKATLLEEIDGLWQSNKYYVLTSRNEKCSTAFKYSHAKEMWFYQVLGDASALFPRHILSFTYPEKPHKRLSLYEALPACLFDISPKLFTVTDAYNLAVKILTLHNKGLAHRDLKSENILIADDCSFKLCDPDSVVLDEQWKNVCDVVGTEDTKSPERYTNYTGSWFPDDVYSLGCLFYEKFYNKLLPWTNDPLEEKLKSKNEFLKTSCNAKNLILSELFELTVPDPEKRAIVLMLWMIHPNQKERPTMQMVVDQLKKLI